MIRCALLLVFATLTAKISNIDAFSPMLLVANNEGVRLVNTSTQEVEVVISFSKGASAVDFHSSRKEVYAIQKLREHRIVRVRFPEESQHNKTHNYTELYTQCRMDKACTKFHNESKFLEPLLIMTPDDCGSPENLLVDWEHDKLYWTCCHQENKKATLNMASLTGFDNKTLFNLDNNIISIDIDPYAEKLFWLEKKKRPLLLKSSTLLGEELSNLHQFDENEVKFLLKVGLDIHKKRIFVVGLWMSDDSFIVSMDYEGSNEKFYSCGTSDWKFGLRSLNSKIFRLSKTALGDAGSSCAAKKGANQEAIDFVNVFVNVSVTDWRIFHPEVQTPDSGYFCSESKCSHSCHHVTWETFRCDCPSGMTLGSDNKTCKGNTTVSKDVKEDASQSKNTKSSDDVKEDSSGLVNNKDKSESLDKETEKPTKTELGNTKPTQPTDSTEPQITKKTSTNVKNISSHSDKVGSTSKSPSPGDAMTEEKHLTTAGDIDKVVVKEIAEAATTVTASSKSGWSIFIVVTVVWFSIVIVVIVIRKRARSGDYQPTSSSDRTDIMMS